VFACSSRLGIFLEVEMTSGDVSQIRDSPGALSDVLIAGCDVIKLGVG